MSSSKQARPWSTRLAACPVILAAVFAGATARGADERLERAGPAFTDPDDRIDMPKAWKKQSIGREEWSRGAEVAVTLDQHLYPALLSIIQEYARANHLNIAVKEGTCGITTGLLSRKLVDIGGFCCPPAKGDRLPGIEHHTIGIAALALIVHPTNPVENVTLEQARGLFQGKVERWSELKRPDGSPGPDARVQPVIRLHCPTRPGHWRLLLDNEELFSPSAHEVAAIPDMIATVGGDPRAVGHEAMFMVRRNVDQGKTKPLSIDGISPLDDARLLSGEYRLYRTLVVTTWESPESRNPAAKELVEYLEKRVNEGALDPKFGIVPAAKLRQAGWKFKGDELVGGPTR